MIYFFRAPDLGQIKIGSSERVRSRLSTLRTASPVKIELMGVMPGGQREEVALHRRFSEARRNLEWFEETPELLDFIREHAEALSADRKPLRRARPRVIRSDSAAGPCRHAEFMERIIAERPTPGEAASISEDRVHLLDRRFKGYLRRLWGANWIKEGRLLLAKWDKRGVSPVSFDNP